VIPQSDGVQTRLLGDAGGLDDGARVVDRRENDAKLHAALPW